MDSSADLANTALPFLQFNNQFIYLKVNFRNYIFLILLGLILNLISTNTLPQCRDFCALELARKK